MVVTGPRSPKRSVFGSDRKFSAGWLKLGRHLHDAFKHMRDRWRRQAVVAVTALFFDAQQAGRGHAVEVAARSLRRDSGNFRQFGCSQSATVHQRLQHGGASRIA